VQGEDSSSDLEHADHSHRLSWLHGPNVSCLEIELHLETTDHAQYALHREFFYKDWMKPMVYQAPRSSLASQFPSSSHLLSLKTLRSPKTALYFIMHTFAAFFAIAPLVAYALPQNTIPPSSKARYCPVVDSTEDVTGDPWQLGVSAKAGASKLNLPFRSNDRRGDKI
jgi:hypothetical protein